MYVPYLLQQMLFRLLRLLSSAVHSLHLEAVLNCAGFCSQLASMYQSLRHLSSCISEADEEGIKLTNGIPGAVSFASLCDGPDTDGPGYVV